MHDVDRSSCKLPNRQGQMQLCYSFLFFCGIEARNQNATSIRYYYIKKSMTHTTRMVYVCAPLCQAHMYIMCAYVRYYLRMCNMVSEPYALSLFKPCSLLLVAICTSLSLPPLSPLSLSLSSFLPLSFCFLSFLPVSRSFFSLSLPLPLFLSFSLSFPVPRSLFLFRSFSSSFFLSLHVSFHPISFFLFLSLSAFISLYLFLPLLVYYPFSSPSHPSPSSHPFPSHPSPSLSFSLSLSLTHVKQSYSMLHKILYIIIFKFSPTHTENVKQE